MYSTLLTFLILSIQNTTNIISTLTIVIFTSTHMIILNLYLNFKFLKHIFVYGFVFDYKRIYVVKYVAAISANEV